MNATHLLKHVAAQHAARRVTSVSLLVIAFAAPQAATSQGSWENINGQLGSLSRENLAKDHPTHAVDLTGTFTPEGFWEFQPYPELKPAAQEHFDRVRAAAEQGITFNDVTGDCFPPGMPIIMTRVWPFHIISVETAIVMVFNFNSQVRWIFMDGREHTDPNLFVPTYNGESIGYWEGDTLVVDTRSFETYNHYVDRLVPLSEEFRIIERMRLIDGGDRLEIEYTMTDPVNWEGEWNVTKTFQRQERVDWVESQCIPSVVNQGLPAMQDEHLQRLEEAQP
jgi:hypothetical protein